MFVASASRIVGRVKVPLVASIRRPLVRRAACSLRVRRIICSSTSDSSSDSSTAPASPPEGIVESATANGYTNSTKGQKIEWSVRQTHERAYCEISVVMIHARSEGVISPAVDYPTESADDDAGFFPVREPGNFPSTGFSVYSSMMRD